jgi:hypothetical protein
VAGAKVSVEEAKQAVWKLASDGELVRHLQAVSGAEYIWLLGGAYAIVWPLVFARLTRKIELDRGHHVCASSVHRLEPDCHDRFQDDVEAVLDDLIHNAREPIANLEGWMVPRLRPVTIDAHRRRRGERGAQQRPRLPLPLWLATALGNDPWDSTLAIEILTWVGIPATAGASIWPLGAWADRRAELTRQFNVAEVEIAEDVERVLAAMRTNKAWYLKYVERPLGRKHAPVLPAQRTDPDPIHDPTDLALVERHEVEDQLLTGLAAVAVAEIEARMVRGEDLRRAVVDVVGLVFGSGTGAEDLDRTPGNAPAHDERVSVILKDPTRVDRIVHTFIEIIEGRC